MSPKRKKIKFEINLFFIKKKFYETLHYSLFHFWLPLIDYHYWISLKYGKQRGFNVLTVLSTKQWNAFAPNLLHELTIFETNCWNKQQLISLEPHIDDLGWGKITDFHKFQKKLLSGILS